MKICTHADLKSWIYSTSYKIQPAKSNSDLPTIQYVMEQNTNGIMINVGSWKIYEKKIFIICYYIVKNVCF